MTTEHEDADATIAVLEAERDQLRADKTELLAAKHEHKP